MKNTLQTLQKKRKSKKGFTLMEMLIVVAIIAILVAISIPIFNAQLENARESTDAANVRAAKAVAVATYLTDNTAVSGYYDAENGKIVDATAAKSLEGYGKGTTSGDDAESHNGEIVKIDVSGNGTVTTDWVKPSSIT